MLEELKEYVVLIQLLVGSVFLSDHFFKPNKSFEEEKERLRKLISIIEDRRDYLENRKEEHKMTITLRDIAKTLDHSTLQPFLTDDDIRKGCDIALQ